MSSTRDRKKPRSIVRFSGEISLEPKDPTDCMIVDLSVSGARIHIEEKSEMPTKFILKIQLFPDIPPMLIRAKRVWRNRDLAGVHFENLSKRDYSVIDNITKIHRGELKQPEEIIKISSR